MRRHWVAYLVSTAIAIALGAGAAYLIGKKASTPNDIRIERISAEQKNDSFVSEVEGSGSGSGSGSAAASAAATAQ